MPTLELSTLFAALSDPTRRAILARLSEGEAPVKDLAAPFDLSGPAITKHLNVLERAGLISRGREGQLRPCRLEPRALAPAAAWIDQYRAMWEAQLDRLDAYLKSLAPAPKQRAAAMRKAQARTPPTGKPGLQPRRQRKPKTPGEPRGRKT
jgi:DNA-binding transcriptional ArsR family regulator